MDMQTYQNLALKTMADQAAIQRRIANGPTANVQLDNGVRGLCNEAGELTDISKRIIEYGKGSISESREHLKEEVGDCFWRLRQICDAAELTFEECMLSNWNKLNNKDGRYPNGYSDFRAAEENRDREKEKKVMAKNPSAIINEMDVREEQTGQGWAESMENAYTDEPKKAQIKSSSIVVDGFETAREIASWLDGQSNNMAMKHIAVREEAFRLSLGK